MGHICPIGSRGSTSKIGKMKVAILDMYAGTKNLGIGAIENILNLLDLPFDRFDIRKDVAIPDLSYDIYISSGGPGNPMDGDGIWDKAYFQLIDDLWEYNEQNPENTKAVFFICHSFQMICHHLGIGQINKRNVMSFGVFPIYHTDEGLNSFLLENLDNPFYVADFREYEVIKPNKNRLAALNTKILAIERERPSHSERALMAIQFSKDWYGVQFHPEAYPEGMIKHFEDPERKETTIAQRGLSAYEEMIANAADDQKLQRTYDTVLFAFLRKYQQLKTPQEDIVLL